MEELRFLVVDILGGWKLDKVARVRSCNWYNFLLVFPNSMLLIEVAIDSSKAGGCKKTAVCPTTLARAAQAKKLMGRDGEIMQVVFITLDPERDTPEILDKYVKAFDPSFEALYGTPEEIAVAAKDFGIFYEKIPAGDSYTLSHTATSFVFDTRGTLRLGLSASLNAKECAEDLLTVMEVC